MKKTILTLLTAVVLGVGLLGGCASNASSSSQAEYGPGEPPLMPANHQGRYQELGEPGCYGCHGGSEEVVTFMAKAPAMPDNHYKDADPTTHEVEGVRGECITCHPQG